MINEALLELLVCPDTKQTLTLAEESMVIQVNADIEAGKVQFVSDATVSGVLDGLLIRKDGQVGYGIFEKIPNLLVSEGIVLTKN